MSCRFFRSLRSNFFKIKSEGWAPCLRQAGLVLFAHQKGQERRITTRLNFKKLYQSWFTQIVPWRNFQPPEWSSFKEIVSKGTGNGLKCKIIDSIKFNFSSFFASKNETTSSSIETLFHHSFNPLNSVGCSQIKILSVTIWTRPLLIL